MNQLMAPTTMGIATAQVQNKSTVLKFYTLAKFFPVEEYVTFIICCDILELSLLLSYVILTSD